MCVSTKGAQNTTLDLQEQSYRWVIHSLAWIVGTQLGFFVREASDFMLSTVSPETV